MKKLYFIVVFCVLVSCKEEIETAHEVSPVATLIPTLDDVSSIWSNCDTLGFMPSLRNFRGQAVANRDMTSLSWFNAPPYSQGYHSGAMKINGKVIKAEQTRWNIYGTERKGQHMGLRIHSDSRMIFDQNGIIWKVEIHNPTQNAISIELGQEVIGFFGKYNTTWQWWYPLPSVRGNKKEEWESDFLLPFKHNLYENERVRDSIYSVYENPSWPTSAQILGSELYSAENKDNSILISDQNSPAKTSFSFAKIPEKIQVENSGAYAQWNITIPPGESFTHVYSMSWGDDPVEILQSSQQWAGDSEHTLAQTKLSWEDKWIALFTPGNSFVSGNFPILQTEDDKASRVYYISALTFLYLMNTNMPVMERVVLTGGPSWGGSIQFFWDTTSWRTIGATADPAIMLETLKAWLLLDINKIYGRDYLSGDGVGYRYVANYWAIFQMLHEYLVVTGDYEFLKEEINGKSILIHMEEMAYNWKNLSREGEEGYQGEVYKLADFGGDKDALLEAVPNYKHIVASFNAGYVGMMKKLSKMYAQLGEMEKSEKAKKEAAEMADRVMELYAGDGIWYGLFPNNERFEIRHILDFHFVGRYMSEEVSPEVKSEMINFVETELMTESWMRAQSATDIAAEVSDRPDHGPLGAYDGWPVNTMEAMFHMGYPEKAIDFYRAVYPVTLEGTWAQAHELWGENKYEKNARVRIARRGLCVRDAASGIAYANVMLREFFGFAPEFMDDQPLHLADMERSIHGEMNHINYQNELYTIISDENGLRMIKE